MARGIPYESRSHGAPSVSGSVPASSAALPRGRRLRGLRSALQRRMLVRIEAAGRGPCLRFSALRGGKPVHRQRLRLGAQLPRGVHRRDVPHRLLLQRWIQLCQPGSPPTGACRARRRRRTDAGAPWGVPCCPPAGREQRRMRPEDGFSCSASPTDAERLLHDSAAGGRRVPGGWWCETVDTAPNVKTATRSFGKTRSVCTPRQYCATCLMDHDCPRLADGTQQHCIGVGAASGRRAQTPGYCAPQCSSNAKLRPRRQVRDAMEGLLSCPGASCQERRRLPAGNDFYQHCDAGTCTQECGSASDCTGKRPGLHRAGDLRASRRDLPGPGGSARPAARTRTAPPAAPASMRTTRPSVTAAPRSRAGRARPRR